MPTYDPHDEESFPKSNHGSIERTDITGAKQKGFVSNKVKNPIAIIFVILLISIFCTLVSYFFLG